MSFSGLHTVLFSSNFGLMFIEKGIVIGLSITVGIFIILLLFGLRTTYKLKAESKRLEKSNLEELDDQKKKYKDFTEGHLYNNN
ncbi:hypothetical protein ACJOV8_015205 [Formosa sp. 3Alg 14/1]|uniref:hypothetical protein n=1 Tax=Formosa sp. 3Alg 14/1 TaxID=3382190 RepID=UPI0039BE8D52